MPFEYILAHLLAQNEGALAVVFVDDEGEAVDLATSGLSAGQVRLAGAYLGITLRQVRGFLEEPGLGEPRLLHVERHHLHLFAVALPEGYLLALLQRRPALVGRARDSLFAAAEELRRELFPEARPVGSRD